MTQLLSGCPGRPEQPFAKPEVIYRVEMLPPTMVEDANKSSLEFFARLRVKHYAEKRYVHCDHCNLRLRRSVVPHLKKKHRTEWSAAVEDWLRLKNSGLNYRRIMNMYTVQEDQYILSWTVIKREVKALAEQKRESVRPRDVAKIRSWKPAAEVHPDTTVWDFPRRGNWAVHTPDYEGNWSPYVPREVIRQYSRKGDLVLDAFVGGGTTLIECVLLGRKAIGVDVSPHSIKHASHRLMELKTFGKDALDLPFDPNDVDNVELRMGDARDLSFLKESSVDLICTHPPYGPAVRYTESQEADLSLLKVPETFLGEMAIVAREFRRVLKKGKYCVILVGDYRKDGNVVPIGFSLFHSFVDAGFKPAEVIVKLQHQDSSTEFYYAKKESLRYRIAHEYLLIFRNDNGKAASDRAIQPA